MRSHGDSGCEVVEGRKVWLGVFKIIYVQQGGEEKLKLHLRQLVPQTHSLAGSEWHEVFWFVKFSFLCQESLWSKLFWLVPYLRVHVYTV